MNCLDVAMSGRMQAPKLAYSLCGHIAGDMILRAPRRLSSWPHGTASSNLMDAVIAMAEPVESHFLSRPQLRDPADELVLEAAVNGQTAAIHFALVPLLYDKTGIPFNLTIGWLVRKGKPLCQYDERLVQRFIEGNTQAWLDEGCPFHLWLTSPAFEILDVTFAMNLGWAKNRKECADLIVYKPAHEPPGDSIYHPTLVGPDFFHKTGGVL